VVELRGLGDVHRKLVEQGGSLLAISVDTPEQSAKVVRDAELPFPILSDPDRSAIKAYGVLHAGGAPDGADIALPADVLIDREGTVVWSHVASQVQNRPPPAEVLSQIARISAR
jgi:peroxiredoxin